MKKIIIILFSLFIFNYAANSQYIDQAIKFSTYNNTGSARFLSMGGAFGALGGDISSISINPAGLGVFRSSELMFTPGLTYDNTSSTFLKNTSNDNLYKFGFSNMGFVASYNLENTDSRWVNSNFAVTYNKVSDLNTNILMSGVNIFSIIEEYVYRANELNEWDLNYEELFWQTWLFDEDTATNLITSDITDTINAGFGNFSINQQKTVRNEGSIGEFNFAFGANYAHKLYLGASIGIYRINYRELISHYEYESENTIDINNFNYLILDEVIKTTGTGFSFKAGLIYKPIDYLRVGFSFHLPTFYEIQEEYYNTVEGSTDEQGVVTAESETGIYEYTLVTPYRINASLGFQIKKVALIDIDYEFVDYSTMKLGDNENGQGRIDDNKYMDILFKSNHTFRGGAEVRYGPIYFRGGASYSTCQFTEESLNSNTDSYSISGGIGYRLSTFYIDFGMRHYRKKYYYGVLSGNPDLDIATIDQAKNNFALTVGFKL